MSTRRRFVLGAIVLVSLALVVAAWGAWALLSARDELQQGRDAAMRAERAVREQEIERAAAALDEAASSFSTARRRLDTPVLSLVAAAPVVGDDLTVVRQLAAAGDEVVGAGQRLVEQVRALPEGVDSLKPSGRAVPVAALSALRPDIEALAGALDDAVARVIASPGPPGLVADVADARQELLETLRPLRGQARLVADAAFALPQMLGLGEPRTYLLLAQNPAEARGTGGFVGAFAELVADDGRLRLREFDEIQALPDVSLDLIEPPSAEYVERYGGLLDTYAFLNANLTPDFPSAAVVLERLYSAALNRQVDGVIAVDPFAFAGLLELAGPVEAPRVGRIGPGNVVEVLSNEAFSAFEDPTLRKRVLGAVAVRSLSGLSRADGSLPEILSTLSELVREDHLLVHVRDDEVQRVLDRLDVSGRLTNPPGDFLAVVGNNVAVNKADYYTRRRVAYAVQLRPDGSATGQVTVTLRNSTPTSGLPKRVIGPSAPGLEAGDNRTLLSVYCAEDCELLRYARSRGDEELARQTELGHPVFTTLMTVPSGSGERVQMAWTVPDAWEVTADGSGRYRLTFEAQPTVNPTSVRLTIELPDGARPGELPASWQIEGSTLRWEGRAGDRLFTVPFATSG